MPRRTIVVTAPSRLHFGLLSFGHSGGRQFGGAGAMIDTPSLRLKAWIAPGTASAQVRGPHAERVRALLADEHLAAIAPGSVCVEIEQAPPAHVGLGTGTQLALALVAALAALREPARRLEASELAQLTGRGLRSAVGTYGFCEGGLIVEAGKLPDEALSPLVCRLPLCDEWRWLLVRAPQAAGLSGQSELEAFASLPPVPQSVTAELCRELMMHLVPAAVAGRFEQFAESLYRYGHLAGTCYAVRQGGAYAGQQAQELVEIMRSLGVAGVGQSSWGPTLFAVLPNQHAAEQTLSKLHALKPALELEVARPNDTGAAIEVREE